MQSMYPTSKNGVWSGYVLDEEFAVLVRGEAKIEGNTLTISPSDAASFGNPYTLTKMPNYTGGGSGGGSGGGTGGTGVTSTLLKTSIFISMDEKKIFRFTVPEGVKKLEIRTFDDRRNFADLLVRRGSDPEYSYNIGGPQHRMWDYATKVADCAEPQKLPCEGCDKVCTFNNPASGQWSAMVACRVNSFAECTLEVTITK